MNTSVIFLMRCDYLVIIVITEITKSNSFAQVADFGLAKIASDTNTHVSTRVMGTFG